jgi:NADH:ubiquinone oxidoreductase subunit K
MAGVGLTGFLVLAAALFAIGLFGAISKKSAVMVLMSLELMTAAVNINLVAISRFVTAVSMTGQFVAAFIMVVAAAEIGLGLALVLALYRRVRSVELDHFERLKG